MHSIHATVRPKPNLPILAVLAMSTLLGESYSAPLHDLLAAEMPARPLPGVVLRTGDPGAARIAASEAGATSVWMALPNADARLGDVTPDPGTLRAGAGGRVRFDGDRRLPLPEGLFGLVRLDADTLGAGTPPDLFADRDVVLVWEDPTVGRKELAPGLDVPVDRGELLAVALASARADASLRVLPLGAAAVLVALVGAIIQLLLARATPRRGALVALGIGAALALAAAGLRRSGIDLPWVGLLAAVTAAYVVRLERIYRDTVKTLDRIVLRLGSPTVEHAVPTGLAGLCDVVLALAPGCTTASWRAGADGAVIEVARVEGPDPLPAPNGLPDHPVSGPGWHIEPVLEAGRVIGALGVAGPPHALPQAADLVRVLATAPRAPAPESGLEPRLAEAEAAVGRALARAERWEHLLGDEGLTIGLFDRSGGLTFASAPLAALATSEPALKAVVGALTGLEGAALAARLREALTAEGPVLLEGAAPHGTVLLHPLGALGARTGVLVQAVGTPASRRAAGTVHAAEEEVPFTPSPSAASDADLGSPPSTS